MVNGLCYESGREMPHGMQVLAAGKIIENEAAVMLQVLKEVDVNCQFCKHAGFNPPCAEDTVITPCGACQYPCNCPCRGCHENSKYEWCGATEALRILAVTEGNGQASKKD